MELDCNFNKEIEPLINSSKSLSDWFERNQEWMAYFGLTDPGCLHFENGFAHTDIRILGRMADGCLTWLETSLPYSDEEKVANAIKTLSEIYNNSKDILSKDAQELYYIDTKELDKKQSNGMHK